MQTKLCSMKCSDSPLPVSAFNSKYKKGKKGYQPYCRECQRIDRKRYYDLDPDRHRAQRMERKKKNQLQIRLNILQYFQENPCTDCGISDVRVLEFDHVRGEKEFDISMGKQRNLSWKRILKEIEKCDVVCCNCHKIRTYTRSGDSYRTWTLS